MGGQTVAAIIDPLSLLAGGSADDLAALEARAVRVDFARGKELLPQGEEGNSLLILTSGTVRISMVAANGREIVLAYAEAGAVLGEIALLDGGERTATVTATSAGSALKLGRNALRDHAAAHPDFSWALMQQLARRLRMADQTIESDRAYSSGPRLARFLRRLIRVENDTGSQARLELSQTELGNFAGMSREHINRQLRAWDEAGIIALEQGRVRILDIDTLSDIAEASE